MINHHRVERLSLASVEPTLFMVSRTVREFTGGNGVEWLYGQTIHWDVVEALGFHRPGVDKVSFVASASVLRAASGLIGSSSVEGGTQSW
ncbi:hypothetical protein [Nocardia abscessus]|uniref:hypothetical protein n=1 Tax=Nocardia abscessus TaxID=120957 RepID=UPI0005BA2E68|nr:hypothetical protein [Nocardia abscessus]MCC3332936.1 hypothetical protein [Nocardia abscessus]